MEFNCLSFVYYCLFLYIFRCFLLYLFTCQRGKEKKARLKRKLSHITKLCNMVALKLSKIIISQVFCHINKSTIEEASDEPPQALLTCINYFYLVNLKIKIIKELTVELFSFKPSSESASSTCFDAVASSACK